MLCLDHSSCVKMRWNPQRGCTACPFQQHLQSNCLQVSHSPWIVERHLWGLLWFWLIESKWSRQLQQKIHIRIFSIMQAVVNHIAWCTACNPLCLEMYACRTNSEIPFHNNYLSVSFAYRKANNCSIYLKFDLYCSLIWSDRILSEFRAECHI